MTVEIHEAPTVGLIRGALPQLAAVMAATMVAISDGMLYGWTAPVNPILLSPDSPIKTTQEQADWLETGLMVGSFCGLPITVYLVDKIGRKWSLLYASMSLLVVWIVTATASNIYYILAVRIWAGNTGNMAFVAAPMYVAEIADQKVRGFLSSLIYMMMLLGFILIYSIAPFVPIWAHCLVGAALVVIQLVTFPFMPESPYFLLYKDRPGEAKEALKRFRPAGANIEKEIEDIKLAVERQKTEKGRPQDLIMVPSNRKAIGIMALLNSAQHMSGISVMLMNLHHILQEAESIYMSASTSGIVFSMLMFIAASIASATIDKYGRKTLLITSSTLTGLCLLTIAIYFSVKNAGYQVDGISWIPVVAVMIYGLSFKSGLGMVPIVLTAELFPAKMKAMGMTIADGFYVLSAIVSLQVFQQLSKRYGMQYPFYVFAFSCFVAIVFTHFFIPETKGKTLEEIQQILKGNHAPKRVEEEETAT